MPKNKKYRSKKREGLEGVIGQTKSEVSRRADAVVRADTSMDLRNSGTSLARDSNTAPDSKEQNPKNETYASTYAALIDKHLLNKRSVYSIVALLAMGWLFLQDNGSGHITDWKDLLWTAEKCTVWFVLFHAAMSTQWAYNKITRSLFRIRRRQANAHGTWLVFSGR